MLQFLGTDLNLSLPADNETEGSLASILNINEERAKRLAKDYAKGQSEALVPVPSMPSFPDLPGRRTFHMGKFLRVAELDADNPNELVLIGYLLGRQIAEMEQSAKKSMRRLTQMMQLMDSDPAKAHKQMVKDLKKQLKKEKNK